MIFSHFIEQKIKAQKVYTTCLKDPNWEMIKLELGAWWPNSRDSVFSTSLCPSLQALGTQKGSTVGTGSRSEPGYVSAIQKA